MFLLIFLAGHVFGRGPWVKIDSTDQNIMKKTLTAVAVLGALSGAAMATEVTLYGVVDTGFTYQHTEGGDDSFAMTSGSYAGPRFGFKGTEDLGDNLTLGFVLEAGFNSDTGAQGEDGKIFNRESQIYLSGDWGTLGFGRVGGFSSGMSSLSWYWDFEPFETGYVDAGIQASQVNVWNVHSNTIYYVSPTFAGAKLGVQYSLTNEADDEDDRWANNSKWLNVALRWDGNNVKVIGAVEAEFYGDSSEYYGTGYDTKNWEDAFSYKLAATWAPGGGATTLYAGLNYFTNNRRMSDANWNEYDFDSDLLKTSSDAYDAISGFLGVRYTVGSANWLAQVQYQDGEFEGAPSGQDGDFKRYAVGLGCHYYFSNRTMGYAVVSWAKGEGWLNKDENTTNRTAASIGLTHSF